MHSIFINNSFCVCSLWFPCRRLCSLFKVVYMWKLLTYENSNTKVTYFVTQRLPPFAFFYAKKEAATKSTIKTVYRFYVYSFGNLKLYQPSECFLFIFNISQTYDRWKMLGPSQIVVVLFRSYPTSLSFSLYFSPCFLFPPEHLSSTCSLAYVISDFPTNYYTEMTVE